VQRALFVRRVLGLVSANTRRATVLGHSVTLARVITVNFSAPASKPLPTVPAQRYTFLMSSKNKSEALKAYLAAAASKTVNSWQVEAWRQSEKTVSK
jgi:hypothetical protein